MAGRLEKGQTVTLSFYSFEPSAFSLWLYWRRNAVGGSFPNKMFLIPPNKLRGYQLYREQRSVTMGMPAPRWSKGEPGRRVGKANSWIQLGSSASLLVRAHIFCLTIKSDQTSIMLQPFWKFKLERRNRRKERGQMRYWGHQRTNSNGAIGI